MGARARLFCTCGGGRTAPDTFHQLARLQSFHVSCRKPSSITIPPQAVSLFAIMRRLLMHKYSQCWLLQYIMVPPDWQRLSHQAEASGKRHVANLASERHAGKETGRWGMNADHKNALQTENIAWRLTFAFPLYCVIYDQYFCHGDSSSVEPVEAFWQQSSETAYPERTTTTTCIFLNGIRTVAVVIRKNSVATARRGST